MTLLTGNSLLALHIRAAGFAATICTVISGCNGETLEITLLDKPAPEVISKVQGPDPQLPYSHTPSDRENPLQDELIQKLYEHSGGTGPSYFTLPDSDDYARIPQDPENPLSDEKVLLGKFLFHDPATGTKSTRPDREGTYSCATCHHASAGFKSGLPQGIADGGSGFGIDGAGRTMDAGMDGHAADDDPRKPDIQPLASPTVLNAAYQDVMLWSGSFGNAQGSINQSVKNVLAAGPAALKVNSFGLSGIETQVLAGTRVHRLQLDHGSVLQTNLTYQNLYSAAFYYDEGYLPDNGTEVSVAALGAAKAIAAYERTLLTNQAPFQRWLKGDNSAMDTSQLRGALLFFGKANCVACHTGPALSSPIGASAEQMFAAVGFSDFDTSNPRIHGSVPEKDSKGRGGFTDNPADDYKFKIPQLYNLFDSPFYGHGASFTSIRDVVVYKNRAIAQNQHGTNLSDRFYPLGLNESEIDDLTNFVGGALYDSNLGRYEPADLPSEACYISSDYQSAVDIGCLSPTKEREEH